MDISIYIYACVLIYTHILSYCLIINYILLLVSSYCSDMRKIWGAATHQRHDMEPPFSTEEGM